MTDSGDVGLLFHHGVGPVGDHVVVCPPLIATPQNLNTIVDLLGSSIDSAITQVPAAAA